MSLDTRRHWLLQALYQKRAWLWPILAFAIITPLTPSLDLAISHAYYYPGQGSDGHGFPSSPLYTFLYNYGTIPALAVFLISIFVLIGSYLTPILSTWRKPALLLFLTYAIGSGLFTHAIFKDHWGRPRPKQTLEFGGTQPFRPYYYPNIFHQPQPSKSFPCGHCTTGFYFFALALIGRRLNSKPLFILGMFLALSLGILLSLARISQGGHFFSDTLASALIMWLTAYGLDQWIYQKEQYERADKTAT